MSSFTRISGEITITPPVPWKAIRNSRLLPTNYNQHDAPDLLLHVEQRDVEVDAGVLNERTGTAVVANYRDSPTGRTVLADLQALIDENPDHEFAGELECNGEDAEDVWRVVVHGRRAVRIDAQIIWPY